MVEACQAIDAESVLQKGEEEWLIAFDEETLVSLEPGPEANSLVLTIPVGRPDESRRAKTYETLLLFNGRWKENGGVRFSLDEPDGELEQIYELQLADLDVDRLATVIGNFVEAERIWRDVMSQGGVEETDEDLPLAGTDISDAIRV